MFKITSVADNPIRVFCYEVATIFSQNSIKHLTTATELVVLLDRDKILKNFIPYFFL